MTETLAPSGRVRTGRPAPPAPNTRLANASLAVHLLAVCGTIGLFGVVISRLPALVSGPDGGNWLALAGALVGRNATAASTVYPPGFLVTLLAAQVVLPPLEALRLAGTIVSMLPGLACYWLLRSLGCRAAALVGLTASATGFSMEMLAWGGYPQLLGMGTAIGAVAGLAGAYRTGQLRQAIVAGCLAGLTLLSHQLAGLQVLICFSVASTVALVAARRAWRVQLRQAVVAALALGATSLPGAPIYLDLVTRAGPSAFNANGFDLPALVDYLTNDARVLWLAVAVLVPLAIGMRSWQRRWVDVGILLGLLVASVGLTLVTLEVRAMYLGQTLGIVSVGVVFDGLLERRWTAWRLATAVVAGAVCLSLAWAGLQRLDRSVRFYAVLDPYFVDGFEWLAGHHEPGDLAAVTPGRDKWPLGWWVQGLGHVPSYLDYDPRWLYFQEEKRQAAVAHAILASSDPQDAAMQAQQAGVTLLVLDARQMGRADEWLRSGHVSGPIGLVYSNPDLAIFRVLRPPAS